MKVYEFRIFHTVVRQNSQTTQINNLLRTDDNQSAKKPNRII